MSEKPAGVSRASRVFLFTTDGRGLDVAWRGQVPSVPAELIVLDRMPATATELSWLLFEVLPRRAPNGRLIVGQEVA